MDKYDVLMSKAHKSCLRNGGTAAEFVWFNAHWLTQSDLDELALEELNTEQPLTTYAECADVLSSGW